MPPFPSRSPTRKRSSSSCPTRGSYSAVTRTLTYPTDAATTTRTPQDPRDRLRRCVGPRLLSLVRPDGCTPLRLGAAGRTWQVAAEALPQTAEYRANEAGLYDYIADAYEHATAAAPDPAVLREALDLLDAYATRYAAAAPDQPLSPRVDDARRRLRERLQALEAAAPPPAPPAPVLPPSPPRDESTPAPRPWRGLAIGGGAALPRAAAMWATFAVGYARSKHHEQAFEAVSPVCDENNPVGECADIYAAGRSANVAAVLGLVLAPALTGASVGLLVIAAKRKRATQQAFAPLLGRGLAGLV